MATDLPELYSESESLRKCNLPATPHWRNWLRSKLPAQSAGGGLVYPKYAVDGLAAQIGDFARATNPPEEAAPPRTATSAPIDGNPRPLANRLASPLTTR